MGLDHLFLVVSVICQECKNAGALNAQANYADRLGDNSEARAMRSEALTAHELCRDINCTCQHSIGEVLNHGRIEARGSATIASAAAA